ncbi:MAG: MarR family transcriptional regulator [Prevotella sp.]|nr:MarR family transcriptional regulator [Prevotella sp.]
MSDNLRLKNQLCFPLYALSRQITSLYRPLLDKLGLTYPQYLVLMVLWEFNQLNIKQLGEMLFLDTGTLTPLLKRMEIRGLLVRKRSAIDERIVDIIITQEGKDLEKEAEVIPFAIKEGLGMDDEEIKNFRDQLNSILKVITDKGTD